MSDKPTAADASNAKDDKEEGSQRQIPGNLPYTSSIGPLKKALEKLIESERPPRFTRDFMSTVLGVSGGAANPVIPILKKVGLISDNGEPADLYAQFQSSSSRPEAALSALRRGFGEIFKRNQYAHKADKSKITDLVREVTGLPANDRIIGYIYNTFSAFQNYAKGADEEASVGTVEQDFAISQQPVVYPTQTGTDLQLSYQINIVLPESTNPDVFNTIFKSLRDNLLR